ncbi:Flp family type IVb pilin [Nocardioides bigeumensis]|uniref:Flp family type IVb pilin n=1 Tax=Nocardioides bigeumensis TaxID=433657 RepID=A0ABN2XST6_9ACTN
MSLVQLTWELALARVAKHSERGASAVEYGLLITGIAALIVIVVYAFGGQVEHLFSDTCGDIQASRGTTC